MDKPPEQVEVDGKLYKINSDFRTSIQFEILMQKKELTEKQKEFANELCLLDKEMLLSSRVTATSNNTDVSGVEMPLHPL